MDGEVDLLGPSKVQKYADNFNKDSPSPQNQTDQTDGTDKKAESFVRPFLKKGTGLSRFYKGQQPDHYLKVINKKPSDRRVQISEQSLDSYPTKENDNVPLSLSGNHETVGGAKLPLKDNTNNNYGEDPEDAELKIFEALEKATGAASFCSTSSLAARFLQTKLDKRRENSRAEERTATQVYSETSSTLNRPPSDLFTPTSSLFGSDDDDDDDEDDTEDEHHHHHKNQSVGEDREASKENSVPIVSLRSPKYDKDIEKLQSENTALKARVLYLEDKVEKNTLEWWSHKEEIMGIVHTLQSSICRKDLQLENIQSTLTQKIKDLDEELKGKSQKWCENQIKMVEKVQLLEDELETSNEKWMKLKNKMQKAIDDVQKEHHVKSSEWATTHERLCNRITALEDEKKKAGHSQKSRINSPESLPYAADSAQKDVQDTILEYDDDEDDDGDGASKILSNGDKETVYFNGTKKVVTRDKSEIRHVYTNGDIRVQKRDGTVKYFYSDSSTWQTTYTNGVEYYEFANGQTERRNPNGMVEVVFANGCVKYSHPSGTEECIFADNTILRVEANGERAVVLPNGQQEIHGSDYKKRIYPDGTIKTVYSDGSQETRYPNGRTRIKDVKGVLVSDITVCKKHSPVKSKLSPRTKPS